MAKKLYIEYLLRNDIYHPQYALYYLCFTHGVKAVLADISIGEIEEEYGSECCICNKNNTLHELKGLQNDQRI